MSCEQPRLPAIVMESCQLNDTGGRHARRWRDEALRDGSDDCEDATRALVFALLEVVAVHGHGVRLVVSLRRRPRLHAGASLRIVELNDLNAVEVRGRSSGGTSVNKIDI